MLKFSKDHEWVRQDGEHAFIGISEYAQSQLGDVVFVELPEIGRKVAKGDEAAIIESVKAASEVYSPIAGDIVAVNDTLEESPDLVNQSAQEEAWIVKLKITDAAELDTLMDEAAYRAYIKEHG